MSAVRHAVSSDFTSLRQRQVNDSSALLLVADAGARADFADALSPLGGKIIDADIGQAGASLTSNTLIDWLLARSEGRLSAPKPKKFGVVKTR